MKLAMISDTHGLHWKMPPVPDADVLIHAGDCMNTGRDWNELWDFLRWMKKLPHKHKILIAGNHDWAFERKNIEARTYCCDYGITYLQDESWEIDGVKFYGSPWQPEFCDWAFNLKRGGDVIKAKWADIPDDTDVLITHGPASGLLDETPRGERVGCADLLDRMCEVCPKVHVCGHIHYGYGQLRWACQCFNASICNEQYEPINSPWVYEL